MSGRTTIILGSGSGDEDRAVVVEGDRSGWPESEHDGRNPEDEIAHASQLVVIGSPDAARSAVVGAYIDGWRARHGTEGIELVLADGEAVWDDERCDFDPDASNAVHPNLFGVFSARPPMIDVRGVAASTASLPRRSVPALAAAVAIVVVIGVLTGLVVVQSRRLSSARDDVGRALADLASLEADLDEADLARTDAVRAKGVAEDERDSAEQARGEAERSATQERLARLAEETARRQAEAAQAAERSALEQESVARSNAETAAERERLARIDEQTARQLADANADEARSQAALATSRQLAGQALQQLSVRPDRALLLAVEAQRAAPTIEARDALARVTSSTRGMTTYRLADQSVAEGFNFGALATSHDGNSVAVSWQRTTPAESSPAGFDPRIIVWSAPGPDTVPTVLRVARGYADELGFSSADANRLVSSAGDCTQLWDIRRRVADGEYPGTWFRFSPDGQRLLVVERSSGAVRVLHLDGTLQMTIGELRNTGACAREERGAAGSGTSGRPESPPLPRFVGPDQLAVATPTGISLVDLTTGRSELIADGSDTSVSTDGTIAARNGVSVIRLGGSDDIATLPDSVTSWAAGEKGVVSAVGSTLHLTPWNGLSPTESVDLGSEIVDVTTAGQGWGAHVRRDDGPDNVIVGTLEPLAQVTAVGGTQAKLSRSGTAAVLGGFGSRLQTVDLRIGRPFDTGTFGVPTASSEDGRFHVIGTTLHDIERGFCQAGASCNRDLGELSDALDRWKFAPNGTLHRVVDSRTVISYSTSQVFQPGVIASAPLQVSPDLERIATIDNGAVVVDSSPTGSSLRIRPASGPALATGYLDEQNLLLVSTATATEIYDTAGNQVATLPIPARPIGFSPNPQLPPARGVLVEDNREGRRLYRADTGELLRVYSPDSDTSRILTFSYEPRSQLLAVLRDNGNNVEVIDLRTGRSLWQRDLGLTNATGNADIDLDPAGGLVAVSSRDGTTRLFAALTGQPVGSVDVAGRLRFSPNGRWLWVDDRLVDVATMRPVGPAIGGFRYFSSDSRYVVAGSPLVSLHAVDESLLVDEACQRAGRALTAEELSRYAATGTTGRTCLER